MAHKDPLNKIQVAEVLRLHRDGRALDEIARQFDRTPVAIRKIVEGVTYQDAADDTHVSNGPCQCRRCVVTRREQSNLDVVDNTECVVQCASCGTAIRLRVNDVRRAHGSVRCGQCSRWHS